MIACLYAAMADGGRSDKYVKNRSALDGLE